MIGYKSIILQGVKIGDGAVIGAKSVVRNDVKPYTIVYGNPAEEKGVRFEKDVIKILLKIKWWNWNIKKINKYMSVLCSDDEVELKKLLKVKR